MSESLNVAERTIERHISKLKQENKIKRKGGRKDGYWQLMNSEK